MSAVRYGRISDRSCFPKSLSFPLFSSFMFMCLFFEGKTIARLSSRAVRPFKLRPLNALSLPNFFFPSFLKIHLPMCNTHTCTRTLTHTHTHTHIQVRCLPPMSHRHSKFLCVSECAYLREREKERVVETGVCVKRIKIRERKN